MGVTTLPLFSLPPPPHGHARSLPPFFLPSCDRIITLPFDPKVGEQFVRALKRGRKNAPTAVFPFLFPLPPSLFSLMLLEDLDVWMGKGKKEARPFFFPHSFGGRGQLGVPLLLRRMDAPEVSLAIK